MHMGIVLLLKAPLAEFLIVHSAAATMAAAIA